MTKSNLDIARECGGHEMPNHDGTLFAVTFGPDRLDAFVERIRADAIAEYAAMTEKGAKAWADVPDATAWVDELRGSDAIDTLPERVEIQAGNVQILEPPVSQPSPAAVERRPLTKAQVEALAKVDCEGAISGGIDWGNPSNHGVTAVERAAFCRGFRASEKAHFIVGITAQQGGEA